MRATLGVDKQLVHFGLVLAALAGCGGKSGTTIDAPEADTDVDGGGAPVVDAAGTDAPVPDLPGTDAPVLDVPGADVPAPDAPGTDAPADRVDAPSDGAGQGTCRGMADCSGAKPLCGPAGVCVQCLKSSDCTNGPPICLPHLGGRCAIEAELIYAGGGPGGGCSVNGPGTIGDANCSLLQALVHLSRSRRVVVATGRVGGLPADPQIVAADGPVTIVGRRGGQENGQLTHQMDQPILHVGSGDLYLQDIAIGPCSNVGVAVDGTGTLHTDRVTFTGNQKGGLRVTGGAGYDIVNTVFAQNGGLALGTAFIGGAALEAPAAGRPGRFAFNTVVGNLRDGVFCTNVSQQLEASLLARQVDGTSAFPDATGCAVAPNSRSLAAADPMLTPSYRITVSSPCLDAVAVPPVGAPAFDIDGVARPQGSAFDCGASELLP